MTFALGTQVIFRSKHGENPSLEGTLATVEYHGTTNDGSGISHWIKFKDGHGLAAYPQELETVPKGGIVIRTGPLGKMDGPDHPLRR